MTALVCRCCCCTLHGSCSDFVLTLYILCSVSVHLMGANIWRYEGFCIILLRFSVIRHWTAVIGYLNKIGI